MIIRLQNIPSKELILNKTCGSNEIFCYELNNAFSSGISDFYPNTVFKSKNDYYYPINEQIMSLKDVKNDNLISFSNHNPTKIENNPVFFFIYNTDNYFHFLYDSLPYLITFLKIKDQYKGIKLLMNYPNSQKREFYPFVLEFLELLGINQKDILIINKDTIYNKILISDSYTYTQNSELNPRKEIFEFFSNFVNLIKKQTSNLDLPKKIYISRRSFIHNNYSNIGTNYTTRRKLENESELVNYLESRGYKEIFTENLSTIDKILLFNNATNIIGPIGGGLANVVFSNPKCELLGIESPEVMTVNKRFLPCFNHVKFSTFKHYSHVEQTDFKKYMRVQYNNIIGEITNIDNNLITISYTDEFVAGWNNNNKYKTIVVDQKECKKLDNGLNSAWKIDLEEFKKLKI